MTLAAQAQARPATADDYVGRWNVTLTDATDTFVSGGIRIDKTDAGLAGGLVWRSGSYAPVNSVEVVDGVYSGSRAAPSPASRTSSKRGWTAACSRGR